MHTANHAFTDWKPGNSATSARTVKQSEIASFAEITGDTNPVHLDEAYAATTRFGRRIAHGMLTASHISAVLGTNLPGPGAIYLEQSLKFLAPVHINDTIITRVEVRSLSDKGIMVLDCSCTNQKGVAVISGQATVLYKRSSVAVSDGTASGRSDRRAVKPAASVASLRAADDAVWPPAGVTPLRGAGKK